MRLVKHCMVLLCKDSDESSREILAEATFEEKLAFVKAIIVKMIQICVESILIFYGLDQLIKPIDLKRELFYNLIANFIIEGELYFLVFNLISNCYQADLQKL